MALDLWLYLEVGHVLNRAFNGTSRKQDVPPPDVEHVHDSDVGVHDDVRRPPHRPRLQTQGDRRGLVGVDGEVLQIR